MNPIVMICCFLFLTSLSFLAYQRKIALGRKRRLARIENKLRLALADEHGDGPQEAMTFSSSLEEVSITTRLQTPRLILGQGKGGEPPEKYRIFARLSRQGMSSEEIAEALNLSLEEARQLARLSRLGTVSPNRRLQG